jgi:hypothetical protein
VLRIIAVLGFAVAAGWLTMAVSAAGVFRSVRPDLVLKLQPADARAHATLADRAARQVASDRLAAPRIGRLATAALQRDPTIVAAWRLLALSAGLQGHENLSARLFFFSQRLSRRDLPTQLWMIEWRVRQNDVAGALRHYDIALRTSPSSSELLMPILVAATSEPKIIDPLAAVLRRDPPWSRSFYTRFAEGAPSAENAVRLLAQIGRDRGLSNREALVPLVARFAERGHGAAALQVYRLVGGGDGGAPGLIRNGGFERSNVVPPLDWQLSEEAEYGAVQEPIENAGQGTVLSIRAESGAGGTVARQMLVLRPGAYRLRLRGGRVVDRLPARLYWSLKCAGGSREPLLDSGFSPGAVAATFRVPATQCQAQWLEIGVLGDSREQGVGAWIDAVRVEQSG